MGKSKNRNPKLPRSFNVNTVKRQPRHHCITLKKESLSWSFKRLETDGPFSWKSVSGEDCFDILSKFKGS